MSSRLARRPIAAGGWHGPKTGPVFVGLHGWSSTRATFDPLVPYLPPGAGLLALDQPGFGASALPEAWTLEAFTDPMLRALRAHGVERATVIGNCAGAVPALEIARRAPERVERLVLVDPFGYAPWYFRLLTARGLGWLFYRATFANPLGRVLTNLALASKRSEDTDLTAHFRAARHRAAFACLRLLCEGVDADRYADLRMPVTIVYGARTFAAVRRSVAIFEALWPQAECIELDGAGHLPIQEATEELARHTFEGSPRRQEGEADGIRATRRLPDAFGNASDRIDLGYDPGLGATLQSDSARAYEW